MKTSALALGIALGTLAMGCEDDDVPAPIDASPPAMMGAADAGAAEAGAGGGDGGGVSASTMCKGTFAMLNRGALGGATMSAGKCSAAADLDLICNDVGTPTRTCGSTCFMNAPTQSEAMLISCTSACVKSMVMAELASACTGCYTGIVACTARNCASQCLADSMAPACVQCQNANNCFAMFFACSGLPGGPPSPDGGTSSSADARAGN